MNVDVFPNQVVTVDRCPRSSLEATQRDVVLLRVALVICARAPLSSAATVLIPIELPICSYSWLIVC